MGDPQFKLAKPGQPEAGYVWTSDVWAKLPDLMRRAHAKYLFVCGDIFEYKVGDGTTITGLWDEWDKYVARFKGAGRVDWITGGHEFWGGKTAAEPRDIFLKRYPDHVRYRIVDGENVFVLFDNLHDPNYLDPNGLAWLEKTLAESASARHVWFFGHVPPRNTADWWPSGERPKKDAFRIRMAELLEKRGITAAFFGHEHMETYLGNPGGFPMFASGCRWPLLVEVAAQGIQYRWLMKPLDEHPLAATLDALTPTPVQSWQVAIVPKGEPLPVGLPDLDPAKPLAFRPLTSASGTVDLSGLPGLKDGDRVLATAEYPIARGWPVRHARIQSDLPFSLWINGTLYESAPPTRGRFHCYMMNKAETNRVVILLDVSGPARTFTYFRHGFPLELQAERQGKP